MRDTWRCIARARAAENLCYVIVTHNIYDAGGDPQSRLGAFIAGPEKMVASREVPGLLVACPAPGASPVQLLSVPWRAPFRGVGLWGTP